MKIPTDIPREATKRPCFNCPFRIDTPPYSADKDIEANTMELLSQTGMAACHFTTGGYQRAGKRPKACSGFLRTVFNIYGRFWNYWLASHDVELDHGIECHSSIADYQRRVRCSDQTLIARRIFWRLSHPKYKELRKLLP